MAAYLDRWETAKTKFTNETGVKKPKPKGFFKSFFNHTGLTSALKDADAAVENYDKTKPADQPKLVGKLEEKVAKLTRAINSYLDVLESSAKDEEADNNAKTELYRNLKVLSAELKAINTHALHAVQSRKIMLEKGLGSKEQAAKMMKTALAAACASAVAAVKKVQATPTPAAFNELFKVSDPPGRKIQVQLISAGNQVKEGKLTELDVDPAFIASKLTPWQGNGSPNNVLPPDATKDQVLKRLEEFKTLLKLALHYSQQL